MYIPPSDRQSVKVCILQMVEAMGLLTDIMQVQAVCVVAWQPLQEGIAVLGGPITRLHQLACNVHGQLRQYVAIPLASFLTLSLLANRTT
jgi:hypothetical protein